MASKILNKALNFTPINRPIFATTHRTAKTNNLYSTINPFGPRDPNSILLPVPTPIASTVLKKALNFTPINTPIFAITHRTAKTNNSVFYNNHYNLYSTINNPFGPGDPSTPIASTILKKALNFTPINTPIFARAYCTTAERETLYYKLIHSLPDANLYAPVLEQWVQEGNKLKEPELQRIVRDLHINRQLEDAMKVIEWVNSKGLPFSLSKSYVELGLIGRDHGVEAAESYFNNLNDEDKTYRVYRTLLECYYKEGYCNLIDKKIEEGLVDKCIAHLQKMMELGFLYSAHCYEDLLSLYRYRGQFENILAVLSDMKEKGVSLDGFCYRLCMDAYGAISDINSMELILKEMKNQPGIDMDWETYATVANVYVRAGLKEKALIYLRKCAQLLSSYFIATGYVEYVSSDYDVRSKRKVIVDSIRPIVQTEMGFVTELGCLVKIGVLEEAAKLVKEWERVLYEDLLKNVFIKYW